MLACPRDGRDADLLMDGEDEVAGCRLLSGGEMGSSAGIWMRDRARQRSVRDAVASCRLDRCRTQGTAEVGAGHALHCCRSSTVKALELLESKMALCVGDARCRRHGRGRRAPCR
ncbi:hypothetical protein ACLOJK_007763 [Asimina triloba]